MINKIVTCVLLNMNRLLKLIKNKKPIFQVIGIYDRKLRNISEEFFYSKIWDVPKDGILFVYEEKGTKYKMICNYEEAKKIFPYLWIDMKKFSEDYIQEAYYYQGEEQMDITNILKEYLGPRLDWYRFLGHRVTCGDITHYEKLGKGNIYIKYQDDTFQIYNKDQVMIEK